jgi:predicted transcriptional regulator
MARVSWLDEGADAPFIDEQVTKLEHFADAMADGVIEKAELQKQQSSLLRAMKEVEGDLNDEQHAKVTRLLVELSAYNVMRTLHELRQARIEGVFGEPD